MRREPVCTENSAQPMCSTATRHTRPALCATRVCPAHRRSPGDSPLVRLPRTPSTQTAARSSRPSVRSGRIDTDLNGLIVSPWPAAIHVRRRAAHQLRRTPRPRRNQAPSEWGLPPRGQPPADAPPRGPRNRRRLLAVRCPPPSGPSRGLGRPTGRLHPVWRPVMPSDSPQLSSPSPGTLGRTVRHSAA
jgi:hypothetical protein